MGLNEWPKESLRQNSHNNCDSMGEKNINIYK